MTDLFVVPDLPETDDDGDGSEPPFDELMLMAQRIMESALSKTDWEAEVLPVAKYLVTDPEDAKVIAKLAANAIIEISFPEPDEDDA